MFIRTLSTTLLQICCEFILHSKVIFKSLTSPDNTGQADCEERMGEDKGYIPFKGLLGIALT